MDVGKATQATQISSGCVSRCVADTYTVLSVATFALRYPPGKAPERREQTQDSICFQRFQLTK